MMTAVNTAASGLKNQQRRLDVISNNVANINTTGYKTARLDFKDAIYTRMKDPSNLASTENLQKGHGLMASGITHTMKTGMISVTGNEMDVCIEGSGFISIQNQLGEKLYTRAGALCVSPSAEGNYLVTGDGHFVLDENGKRILFPDGSTISEKGEIFDKDKNKIASMGIFDFDNSGALESVGNSSFRPTMASGEPFKATNFNLKSGALEASNVDLAQEMTLMIRTQRAFQLASRALTTADSMDGLSNNIRR